MRSLTYILPLPPGYPCIVVQDAWFSERNLWPFLAGIAFGALITVLLFLILRRPPADVEPGKQTAFRKRAFHALLSISEAIDEQPSVSQVFQRALDAVQEATGFDAIAMRIYERDGDCFRLVAQRGMSPAMVQELACIPADKGFQAEVARTKQPAVSANLAEDPRLGGSSPLEMGYRSLASVPLLADGELMGTMELASPETFAWTPEQVSWLSLVGRSVGVFLYHVQLTSHLRDLAVLKERSLIAQEIHDGLAQLVGSIYMWAEDAQLSLQEGDKHAVEKALNKIDHTARDAYAVLREEILGLRQKPQAGQGLMTHLAEILDRFRRQWGIDAQLTVAVGNGDTPPASISPSAEIQLLRILQEALSNVRRHACANKVHLKMDQEDGWLVAHLEDDGRGFDPHRVSEDHLGLSIMRERAASVGGRLNLQSAPGQGTCVRIELPPRSQA